MIEGSSWTSLSRELGFIWANLLPSMVNHFFHLDLGTRMLIIHCFVPSSELTPHKPSSNVLAHALPYLHLLCLDDGPHHSCPLRLAIESASTTGTSL